MQVLYSGRKQIGGLGVYPLYVPLEHRRSCRVLYGLSRPHNPLNCESESCAHREPEHFKRELNHHEDALCVGTHGDGTALIISPSWGLRFELRTKGKKRSYLSLQLVMAYQRLRLL